MAQADTNHKAVNRWVSRIIPIVLTAIVVYVTWVVVEVVSVKYLLKPSVSPRNPRNGATIVVLILYFLFLLAMAITYFRLVYVVVVNPGYVERSVQWYAQNEERNKARSSRKASRDSKSEKISKRNGSVNGQAYTGPNTASGDNAGDQRPSLQEFFKRDVFICQGDGRPTWCSQCLNWKPDRAHHCREVDRCVKKMDHFCPWVGGIVGETSFKFFIQFVGWATIYCCFVLVTMAIFVAESEQQLGRINTHWIITLAMAGLFGLFTAGMTGSSLGFVFMNTTTIENLSRKSVVYQLAIHMPQPPQEQPAFPTITFSSAQDMAGSIPLSGANRTFAILHSKPGQSPWDLGWAANFRSVMGERWHEWFLPVRYSPCCNHDRYDSQFSLGPVVCEIRRDAGISSTVHDETPHKRRRHKRRRRRPRESAGKEFDEKVIGRDEIPDHGHERSTSRGNASDAQ